MPNCFTLTKKNEAEPSPLVAIDEAICKMLGVPPDPQLYVEGWVDSIGLKLAMGRSLAEVVEEYRGRVAQFPGDTYFSEKLKIAEFLEKEYTSNAWAQRGW